MGFFTGVIVYLLIWWLSLFTMLPMWVKRVEKPELGHSTGAPENPHLLKKFIFTSILAAVLWLIVYIMIKMDVVDFRQWANMTMEQGLKE